MDHPFRETRLELTRLRDLVATIEDVLTLMTISSRDHTALLHRREPEIRNEDVRRVACDRSDGMGLLLEEVDDLSGGSFAKSYGDAWRLFLTSSRTCPDRMKTELETLLRNCKLSCEGLAQYDCDDTSSSYSDYSDSRTVSSRDTN